MNWSEQMAEAYQAGLLDGREGFPSRANEWQFGGSYQQGWDRGDVQRMANIWGRGELLPPKSAAVKTAEEEDGPLDYDDLK